MPDMLVKLYDLPDSKPILKSLEDDSIIIKRAIAPERFFIVSTIEKAFGKGWAGECDTAFSNQPVSCFIALKEKKIIGFACYDATCKNFFGPTAVDPEFRGKGIGKALLLKCLEAMEAEGYAYAVIGGAGPVEFYKKAVNATIIEGSVPGIYKDMISE